MSDEVEMRGQDTALLDNSEDVLNGKRVTVESIFLTGVSIDTLFLYS